MRCDGDDTLRSLRIDWRRETMGSGRRTGTAPGEHEAGLFAVELARRLHKDRAGHRFDALVLVADPSFLGLLRNHLDDPNRKQVILEVDKNLAHMDAAAIRAHLPERLDATDHG